MVPDPAQPTAPGQEQSSGNPPLENLQSLGTQALPQQRQNVYTLSIIGQIEGHLVLPPQHKTTKYEHLIPQLVAVEQSP